MFLRSRLKSAYACALTGERLVFTGIANIFSGVILGANYKDGGDSTNNFVNLQFPKAVQSNPFCKMTYEVWDPKFTYRKFTCDPTIDEVAAGHKFLYMAKNAGWEDWKNYAAENWIYYLIVPTGLCMAVFAAYGFVNAEEFIRQEQLEKWAQEDASRAERQRQAQQEPKKIFKNAQTQTEHFLFFKSGNPEAELPPAYEPSEQKGLQYT